MSAGVPALTRRQLRGATLVLAYHNIVPAGGAATGERSLHLPQTAFAAQLDLLTATHEVVPLIDLLAPGATVADRPRAAITFDDAYRGAVTAGGAELAQRSLPATIFVAPAFVGGGTFWWDALAARSGGHLADELRAQALTMCRGEDAAVRRWAAERGLQAGPLPDHTAVASEAELRAALGQPGITLGSHSWSHPNLTRLGPAELEQELTRPAAWLRERFDQVVPVLAYPYGLFSPDVARAAAAAGYSAALGISGGWQRGAHDRYAWPRLNVPAGLSRRGFTLRTGGLFCA